MEKISKNMNEEDLKIKSQMEKMVHTYDTYMKRITFGNEDKLRQSTVELAQIKQGDHVLEIGCATGSLTIAAKKKAGKNGMVAAIDIIPGMIEYSREKAAKAGLEIDFKLGSIDGIPFADEQFNVVMCSFMIFHMSDKVRNKGFEEIYRVLKPGGRLLILDMVVPATGFSRNILKLILGFALKHELNELNPAIASKGFNNTEIARFKYRVLGLPLLSYLQTSK
jgi:ubiquinone/menaquinone biosynthesis C-methylase UbiE